jgi:hypothetical protein
LFDLEKGFGNFQGSFELKGINKTRFALRQAGYETLECLKESRHPTATPIPSSVRQFYFENLVKENNGEEKALQNYDPRKMLPYVSKIARIKRTLKDFRIGELVIPGGVYGWSGAYLLACRNLKIPFWTYDSGDNLLTLSKNCIASHFDEFHQGLKKIKLPSHLLKRLKASVVQTHKTKYAGKDNYAYLKNAKKSKKQKYYSDGLILLNYRCDTAAMLRSKCFENVEDWLCNTAKWFISNKRRLIIRRHPCENNQTFRSSDSYNFLKKIGSKYIYFIDYHEHINTYMLINQTKVVLPFTSKVGLEALFLEKPVIISSKCYYENVSSILKARSKKQYFDLLKRYTTKKHKIKVTPEILAALFLAEECLFTESLITPMPEKFSQWATMNISSLEKDKGFALVLKCISENKNFIHERFKEKIYK